MALDANTFLIVVATAIVVMGFVVWVMFRKFNEVILRRLLLHRL